jgi:hypothetical protein
MEYMVKMCKFITFLYISFMLWREKGDEISGTWPENTLSSMGVGLERMMRETSLWPFPDPTPANLKRPQTLRRLTILNRRLEYPGSKWDIRICRNHHEGAVGSWIRGILSDRITGYLTRGPAHLAPLPPTAHDAGIPHCADILCAWIASEYHITCSDRSCVQL